MGGAMMAAVRFAAEQELRDSRRYLAQTPEMVSTSILAR
jgi:hypothetical protein